MFLSHFEWKLLDCINSFLSSLKMALKCLFGFILVSFFSFNSLFNSLVHGQSGGWGFFDPPREESGFGVGGGRSTGNELAWCTPPRKALDHNNTIGIIYLTVRVQGCLGAFETNGIPPINHSRILRPLTASFYSLFWSTLRFYVPCQHRKQSICQASVPKHGP